MAWTLAQAKEHLEEIAARVSDEEPQTLDIGGRELVIVPAEVWRRVSTREPTMKELILSLGPLDDIDFTRNPLPSRALD